MLPTAKLTKRQKKGIVFRERKRGKRKANPLDNLEDAIDVPILEDQVTFDAAQGQQGCQVGAEALVGRGKAGEEAETQRMVVARKERRRKTDEEEKGVQPTLKRRRGSNESLLVGGEQYEEDGVGAGVGSELKTKQRFILFLGNLKYTTTLEVIEAHFSVCVPPPVVRLLTPKQSPGMKPVKKSKGCAFLEFRHRGALQQGLKLHHSQLDGRQINVELTAGGGGKGAARVNKLKERNKELEGQRKQRDHRVVAQLGELGAKQTHAHKLTPTISRAQETETHPVSLKHQRKPKRQRHDFGTGVNAIPIG